MLYQAFCFPFREKAFFADSRHHVLFICFRLILSGILIFPYGEPSYSLLLAFNFYRVIGGVGVGLASAICPMYIAEIAPSSIRGTLVSWNQFAIIFGQLVVYFVNFLILGDHLNPVVEIVDGVNRIMNPEDAAWSIETGWRLMFVSEAVPAGLFTLLVLFVPETPRYLAMTGRDEKPCLY